MIRLLEQADAERLAREDTYRLRQRVVDGDARARWWQTAAISAGAAGLGAGLIGGLWLAGVPGGFTAIAALTWAVAFGLGFIGGRLWQAVDATLRALEPESRREGP